MKLFFFILIFIGTHISYAAEGFQNSKDKNVVMLKASASGGTAFVMKTENLGAVLVTQMHVLELGKNLTLQWGYKVGSFFRLIKVEEDAFKIEFQPEVIWQDEELDIAVLKIPQDLLAKCKCGGYDIAPFIEGESYLVGYPIKERRIWPRTSRLIWMWKELFGEVEQQMSSGKVWKDKDEYLGDMDAISGNSGGPILQNGKAIGIIHMLKTWKGEGYRYKNPSLNFIPLTLVSEKLKISSNL